MQKKLLTTAVLMAGLWSSSATVTVEGWWHYGEVTDIFADSSPNLRRFAYAFSSGGSSTPGAVAVPVAVGGPLGTVGWYSTNSLYWTPQHYSAAAMWNPWRSGDAADEWNPPATNYTIECWILPTGCGIRPNTSTKTWFWASGSGDFSQPTRPARTGAGGVYFAVVNDTPENPANSKIGAFVIANASQGVAADTQIGDLVPADYNKWMHIAVVNDNGVNSFYVNGVKKGASQTANTIPNGNIFGGGSPGTTPTFDGYLDELRITTFAPGAFALSDLLLRPPGPSIVSQPKNAYVWDGGAAPFELAIAYDTTATYQWRRSGTNITGATQATYVLPTVTTSDSGSTFDCIATSGGASVTSSVATLTVVGKNPSDIAAYRNAINAQASLIAYFPADGASGTTLPNAKDAAYNGVFELNAYYDGRTNRSFGERAVASNGDADVIVPWNTAYDFSTTGNGTIEAIVYMKSIAMADATVCALASDSTGGGVSYAIRLGKEGASLAYYNGTESLSWPLSVGSIVAKKSHIAFVFSGTTTVTAYLNGESLGVKTQTAFGPSSYFPFYIGGMGTNNPGNGWPGSIDEVALYSSALSGSVIQDHYSKMVYGTNTVPPSIVSLSPSKTLFIGASPTLSVKVVGPAPYSYQWSSNNVAITGATADTYTIVNAGASASADYRVTITNPFGSKESDPVTLTFVAASGYAQKVMATTPRAYYRLNETSGTVAIDSAGYNDATYSASGFTRGVAGVGADNAVSFSGGDAQAPWSPGLNNPAGPFSVEFWVKPADYNLLVPVASQYRVNSRAGYCFYANNGGNFFCFDFGKIGVGTVYRLNGTSVPTVGEWHHVVTTYDAATGTGTLYVNGTAEATDSAIPFNTAFQPNPSNPFIIGNRNGGGLAYNGVIDEVAVYDHTLTYTDVTNHWSIIWTPAAVVTEPVGVTTNEWSTVTLSAVVSGIPNTYKWQKNNADLTAGALNADGTAHYPNGVKSTTLTISQAKPSDNGNYKLVISNPLGGANATVAVPVSIIADTTKPEVVSVMALGTINYTPEYGAGPSGSSPYLVKVLFSERISYANPGTYTIPGKTVSSALVQSAAASFLGGDWREVILKTDGLTPGQQYTLTVSGAQDQAEAPNTMNQVNITFRAPLLSKGLMNWDYYYYGTSTTGNPMLDLTGSQNYPDVPWTNWGLTTFNSQEITGGQLENRPGWGSLGNNYGAVVSGWVTPTVSGSYRFFLHSDDASELYLSTSADPVASPPALIAYDLTCCHGFTEPTNDPPVTYISGPISLQANTPYFIYARHTEGGGQDYVRVAWRREGDSTPAASLTPIPGQYLSSYAPSPLRLTAAPASGGKVKLTWTGTGTLLESSNLSTWAAVSGNPTSPHEVTPGPGTPYKFYRLQQ